MAEIGVSSMEGSAGNMSLTVLPDECPICLRGTKHRLAGGIAIGPLHQIDSEVRILFQCTWNDCNEAFLGYYSFHPQEGYILKRVAPRNPPKTSFPDSITPISKDFIQIHNQAMAAESNGLDQITGIGLRKALEFLIKDFLINQEPAKADEIKGKLLGKCIDDHVTDPNIKATAKRATWLGNDETHYVRRWEDKDINDLKVLIRLTVNWIDSALLTQQYVKEMNP